MVWCLSYSSLGLEFSTFNNDAQFDCNFSFAMLRKGRTQVNWINLIEINSDIATLYPDRHDFFTFQAKSSSSSLEYK